MMHHHSPSISNLIHAYNLVPNKKLGQNFLLDTDITDRITRSAGPLSGINVLEIGPGIGTLTRSLLASDAKHIYMLEQDEICIKIIKDTLIPLYPSRLTLLKADALHVAEGEIVETPVKIIANLPYNIGTKLLLKWLHNRELFQSITVMLQKEVVDRIVASPATQHYGRLSIICQILSEVEKNFDVEPYHFYPAPKVVSSVVTLKPRASLLYNCHLPSIEHLTHLLFSQRRKMIRSILKHQCDNLETMLENLGISPLSRPENLTIKNICDMAQALFAQNNSRVIPQ